MKTANQLLLRKVNEAFANNDTAFILENVTDNICWEIIGDRTVKGREAFAEALKSMQQDEPFNIAIHHIITHGKHASVNGVMTASDGISYGFCDVVTFSSFKNPKIKKMTSYAIKV
jgi:hypothetical protein